MPNGNISRRALLGTATAAAVLAALSKAGARTNGMEAASWHSGQIYRSER